MPDSSFMVDLAALLTAIDQVSGQTDAIRGGVRQVKTTFAEVEGHWRSPSGTSFATLATEFNGLSDQLVSLLEEAIGRMRTAYNNYAQAEVTNTNNYR